MRNMNTFLQYYVADEEGHAVPLDSGLIESGTALYLSGYVDDVIDDENESKKKHVIPAKRLGPLIEWWFSGFDGSDQIVIGVETEFASYILVKANPAYNRFVQHLIEKISLCKLVIEFLTDSPDASYGELIEAIRARSRSLFNGDTLLTHSEFVIQQVTSYDEAGSESDVQIAATSAFRELINFSGTPASFASSAKAVVRKDSRRLSNSDTSAVTTPLVSEFFQHLKLPIAKTTKNMTVNTASSKSKGSLSSSGARWSFSAICQDTESGRSYYSCVKIGSREYGVNDFVVFRDEEKKKDVIGQIRWMYETRGKLKLLHVLKYVSGRDTILGSTAHEKQLFAINECQDIIASHVIRAVSVLTKEASLVISRDSAERGDYFCYHLYIRGTGTFTRLNSEETTTCSGCVPSGAQSSPLILAAGDFVCIKADSGDRKDFLQTYFHQSSPPPCSQEQEGTALYPEKYRKAFSDGLKGSFAHLLPLLTVARIESLEGDCIRARLMYRAQNIFSSYDQITAADIREIFWTNTLVDISRRDVVSKCSVRMNDCSNLEKLGSFDFFLHRELNHKTMELEPIDKGSPSCTESREQDEEQEKWKTLDLFSGCGGMALGFKQSGLTQTKWAIEKDAAAGQAFRLNFPESTVFVADANKIMRDILRGNTTDQSGCRYPEKGEVDIILAGPPCQGFSEMNRFSSGTYSLFKNSLIATTLSFVDYYRPKYVYLENVRNFLKFGRSMMFKMTLSCFVRMGYQVRFMLLQAGFYGLPQARSRLFIVAAAPDCLLPDVPPAAYSFPERYFIESVIVDDCRYFLNNRKQVLYRNMTIRDAIADLPRVGDGSPDDAVDYDSGASSTYQKRMRSSAGSVSDHVSRKLNELNLLRVQNIPREKGADWRDLPNQQSVLQNGTPVHKLEYRFSDGRGVCPCASGQPCEGQKQRQENTLIPWCLVHTADRNYHWSGLYGRLHWDQFFSTTVTIPEPSSKQGRVIHPAEDRVLSVRECARSQGFPDHFRFAGSTGDRYRQVMHE